MSDRIDPGGRDPYPRDSRGRPHPLFWLLVLAALLAFGWTFYNWHASRHAPAVVNPVRAPASAPAPNRSAHRPPRSAPRK